MSRPLRWCNACGQKTYVHHGVCNNPDCPLNRPTGTSSASGRNGQASSSNDDWQQAEKAQHQAWQEEVWHQESAKERRKRWWQERQGRRKRQRWNNDEPKQNEEDQNEADDQDLPRPSMSGPASNANTAYPPPEPKTPPTQPEPKAAPAQPAPKPAPKPTAKPRGSAGRAGYQQRPSWAQNAPWHEPFPSSEDEDCIMGDIIVETPGPVIEELAPELEWYPAMTGSEICDVEPPLPPPAFSPPPSPVVHTVHWVSSADGAASEEEFAEESEEEAKGNGRLG